MFVEKLTCNDTKAEQMINCERGLMNDGLFADCLPALKILAIRFVFVSNAA